MRLCISDSGLNGPYRSLTEDKFKVIHDIGFRVAGLAGIDINATDSDISRIKDLFAKYDMSPGPAGAGTSPFFIDAAAQKKAHDSIKAQLPVAAKVGVTNLRCSGGCMGAPEERWDFHPENHTQKAMDMMVEATKKLVPYLEDSGVIIATETTQWTIVNSIERMKEFVDRVDSPFVKVIFDVVNHMTPERVMVSGKFFRCAVATLGDRITELHVKDVTLHGGLVVHIDEAPMGTGYLDHASIIAASNQLEPWKPFSLEHFNEKGVPAIDQYKRAYTHIMKVSNGIGHKWSPPSLTRLRFDQSQSKKS